MDLRKRRTHSNEKLPLGTTRWTNTKRSNGSRFKVKMIKVAHVGHGRSGGKWINYSRWLWERHHGPVPKGQRVIHKDGDLTNFALANLVLGTAADVLWIHCHRDPEKSKANHRACGEATAAMNRDRAQLRRQLAPLPSYWYAVDLARRVIVNQPGRKMCDAAGRPAVRNGSGLVGWRLGWPGLTAGAACLLAVLVRAGRAMRMPELMEAVRRLRTDLLIVPAVVLKQTLYTAAVRLAAAGLMARLRRGQYIATPQASGTRGPVCPCVFVRGSELLSERFAGFELVEPSPNLERCAS